MYIISYRICCVFRQALLVIAAASAPLALQAQTYPDHVIKLIVAYPPGGGNDTLGRLVAQRLSSTLGQQVIVENKPGAGGNLGTEQAARAKPDGYTLMLGFVANMAMTPSLGKVNYDALNGFARISMVAQGYQILSVNPAFSAKSVAELIALAKDKPNTLNYGSGGSGTPLHLVGEPFKMRTGTDIQHVPYKGSPQATSALLAGGRDANGVWQRGVYPAFCAVRAAACIGRHLTQAH